MATAERSRSLPVASYLARSRVRRFRLASLGLAALFGLSAGVIAFSMAAERRADGSLNRFLAAGRGQDMAVTTCPPGVEADSFEVFLSQCLTEDWAKSTAAELARMPEVETVSYGAFHVVAVLDPTAPNGWGRVGLMTSVKTRSGWFASGQPIVVAGRLPRVGANDEVLVSEEAANFDGLELGATLKVASWSGEHIDQAVNGGLRPETAPVALKVVGVGRFTDDLEPPSNPDVSGNLLVGEIAASGATGPRFYGWASYGHAALVRLKGGPSAVEDFAAAVQERWSDRFVQADVGADRNDDSVQAVIDNERRALIAFAGIALLATLGFAGLTLVRQLAREQAGGPVLAALGLSRRDLAVAGALRSLAVAVPAAAIAVVTAVALSPLAPVGVARRAEPHIGLRADVTVLAITAAAIVLIVEMVGAGVPLLLARQRRAPVRRASRIATLANQLGPTARSAMVFARGGWPRTAAVVSGVAIAGVVAAGVAVASLDRVVAQPGRYGANWDLVVGDYAENDSLLADVDLLRRQPDVEAMAGVLEQTDLVEVNGRAVDMLSLVQFAGRVDPTMTKGRPPAADDEVALGRRTMDAAGVEIGDTVVLRPTGDGTIGGPRTMTVTGEVVVANPIRLSGGAGDGAYVTTKVWHSISPAGDGQELVIRVPAGVAPADAVRRLAKVYRGSIRFATPPDDVRNLDRLRVLPWAIAALVTVLALATLVHALITMVHRNRQDLAVLSVLGLSRTRRRRVVTWATGYLTAAAVLAGVPLGVVGGRLLWRALASGVSIPSDPSVPLVEPVVVALAAVAVGLVVAGVARRPVAGSASVAAQLRRD